MSSDFMENFLQEPGTAWCFALFLSNGNELVGEGLDPRRRRPRLAADAAVDLQGAEADAPAPLHGGSLALFDVVLLVPLVLAAGEQ
jgi:hypothetical protein